jgi:hypothetical protein
MPVLLIVQPQELMVAEQAVTAAFATDAPKTITTMAIATDNPE